MSWNDRRRRLAPVAVLLSLAVLAGCGRPAGDIRGSQEFGVALNANVDLQTGRGGSPEQVARLSDAFRAAAPDTVNFDFDRADLGPEAQIALALQAAWLRASPEALMRLEGHADLVGTERYNDRLGLRRARAVAAALASLGVDPARLRAVESRGFREPLVPVSEPERRNRRVLTVVEGAGSPVRGAGMDGKRAALAYGQYTTRETAEVSLETLIQ